VPQVVEYRVAKTVHWLYRYEHQREVVMPMTKVEIEKLARKMGARPYRHGASHDIWKTVDGKKFQIPCHPGDLSRGTEKTIKRLLGIS